MYDPPSYLWAMAIAGIIAILAATCVVLYGGAMRQPGRRRAALLAAGAAAVLGGWFTASAVIADHGWYHTRLGHGVPWMPVAVVGFLGLLLALRRIPVVARALAAPGMTSRLELPHSFRAVDGVAFLLIMALGHLPALFALPAGLGDIAAGIAAPLVARKLAQGTGRRTALWFNAFGMTDLIVALTLGAVVAYQLIHITPSGAPISELPLAVVPTVGVPLLLAVHITSVTALVRARRTPQPATAARSRPPRNKERTMTRAPSKPLVLVALLTASFVINLDTTLVNVALPTLTRELGATTAQLQWVVDAYNLVFAALLLTSGSLSDRFGRKGMLMAGLAVSAWPARRRVRHVPGRLIAARAVMGLGAAMTFPATLSLLTGVFTGRKERAVSIGLWGATAGLAIALGPIVGGFLLGHFSWSSIFYTLGPVSLAVIVLAARFVPVPGPGPGRPGRPGPDPVRPASCPAGLHGHRGARPGLDRAATLLGFAGAAVLLAAFMAGERRTRQPMLDVRLFANLRFSAASAAVTIAFFTLSGFIFLMTQYFQFVRAYSPLSTGVHLLPVAISVAIGSTLGTRLAVRLGTKAIVTAGLALQAASTSGWPATSPHPQLRADRRPDGRLRPGHGPDVRARDRVDYGSGPPARPASARP